MTQSTGKDNKAAALTYNGRKTPIISALGEDQKASAIVKLAEEHKVPIYQDEDLVRILSQFEVGQPIPPELYEWVARVLAFAFFVKDQVPEGFSPTATRSAYQRVRDAYGKPDITP